MESDFENPFADYGNIVSGNRFIGRHDSLREIESRVINPSEPGNMAIIGNHRIGKSSLVFKAIMDRRKVLQDKKQLPVWINLATCDQASSFFRSLVTGSYNEIDRLDWLTPLIVAAAESVCQDGLSWTDSYFRIQRFFERVRQAGIRILFVLDEFDHARKLFKDNISAFQALRELSYNPEWRVTFITTSRRTIRNIELQTGAISNFDLTLHKLYLGMFDESDIEEYFARISSIGIEVTEAFKEKVRFYCGRHPHLLEVLGYEIVKSFSNQHVTDVDQAADKSERSFFDQYEHMVSLLNEDDSLKIILQILFGPVVDVKPTHVNEFQLYGLIQPNQEGNYCAFSEHFQTYLRLIERQSNLWPIWKKTEIALRNIITTTMREKYGEPWIDKLEKAHSKLKPIFDKCREAQQKEEKSFKDRASCDLIDYTYPQDLFAIIFAEWVEFKALFGKDTNYWAQRADLLARVRNPLAHNREQILLDYERQIAEGYCNEILETLRTNTEKHSKANMQAP
ncbi:MAG: Swt1 family HEPN domain-containing protein [Candidatus Magnetobacterium sp. LHC-1]|nr:ATP-binding protein [Nitrospirota bacterium]